MFPFSLFFIPLLSPVSSKVAFCQVVFLSGILASAVWLRDICPEVFWQVSRSNYLVKCQMV
jgi:hypothetical protein